MSLQVLLGRIILMKCLLKYKWVKLRRTNLPIENGLLGSWGRLASCAAYRKGIGIYCGYRNPVTPGMWAGGIIGLKSILGVRRRSQALQIMNELTDLGYVKFTLDTRTKKLTYEITDWVANSSGAECTDGAVYATEGYGFICVPRSITERLVEHIRIFDEADAWLDLWCHTVYRDYGNAFSFFAPAIQYRKYGAVLTLETLGKRWGWEKTKVWRFFRKNSDTFALYRLPGSYGCLIYNRKYLDESECAMPDEADVLRLLADIRNASRKGIVAASDSERLNRMISWYSRIVIKTHEEQNKKDQQKPRVASVSTYTRAYFSHGRNCKYGRNCIYDCWGVLIGRSKNVFIRQTGAVCPFGRASPFFLGKKTDYG